MTTFEERQYPLPSKIIQANVTLLTEREKLGLRKYGHTLDRTDLTHRELLQHALEESLDLSNYLQAAMQRSELHEKLYQDLSKRLALLSANERRQAVRSSTQLHAEILVLLQEHENYKNYLK